MAFGEQGRIVFEQLIKQADELSRAADAGVVHGSVADSCRRASLLFCVAAVDSYFGEIAVERATGRLQKGCSDAYLSRLAEFLHVKKDLISGPYGGSYIRYHMAFKTFVDPGKIDSMYECVFGIEKPETVWRHAAVLCSGKQQALRAELDLQYDRRNKIAHEGDWDPIQYRLRVIGSSDVQKARETACNVVNGSHDWLAANA